MTGNLQPLDEKFAIVGPDGRPTLYFVRWAQQRQIDIQGSVSAEQALQIAQDYVLDLLATNPLIEGVGIDLTPSGNVAEGVTISANAQAILDVITDVQGSILYRGASDWSALAPGTAGQFLQTAGPAADPLWAAAGGGGGGGSYFNGATMIDSVTTTTPYASKGIFITPSVDVSVTHFHSFIAASGASQDIGYELWDLSSITFTAWGSVTAATVGTLLASETAVQTSGTFRVRDYRVALDTSPVTLIAGQTYLVIVILRNGSSGTDPVRVLGSNTADGFALNFPGVTASSGAEFNTIGLTPGQSPSTFFPIVFNVWLEGTF